MCSSADMVVVAPPGEWEWKAWCLGNHITGIPQGASKQGDVPYSVTGVHDTSVC